MAILRALDGTFYEVPDDQVAKYKIPDDKVKEKLGAQAPTEGAPQEAPPEGGAPVSPLVNVHIYYAGQGQGGAPGAAGAAAGAEGAVQPYDWRNWNNWRNWRNWNNWRNHW
jgi:hypothetical protein